MLCGSVELASPTLGGEGMGVWFRAFCEPDTLLASKRTDSLLPPLRSEQGAAAARCGRGPAASAATSTLDSGP